MVNRDATRSGAANSDNRTRPRTRYVQWRGTVSSECLGELSEKGVYHSNLQSSITCCEGNYNSSDHKFTLMCYTHYDIICNHAAGFARGIMPYLAGQCNCSHRQQSHASFRERFLLEIYAGNCGLHVNLNLKPLVRSSSVGIVTGRCAVTILALQTI